MKRPVQLNPMVAANSCHCQVLCFQCGSAVLAVGAAGPSAAAAAAAAGAVMAASGSQIRVAADCHRPAFCNSAISRERHGELIIRHDC